MNRDMDSKDIADFLRIDEHSLINFKLSHEWKELPREKKVHKGRSRWMFNKEEVMQWLLQKYN